MKTEEKETRIAIVNEIIKEISNRSRRFFYNSKNDNVSKVILKHGRLFFVDHYSGKEIYLHQPDYRKWKGFNNGGTMKALIKDFKEYIMTGQYCNHNNGYGGLYCPHWGYTDEDMKAIQERALELGYLSPVRAENLKPI